MGGIHVNDPAPRNQALELTGQPSLSSGLGLGATAEESFIRSPFSPLRHQELMEATAGTEMPETGPVDTGIPPLFQDKPITPREQLLTPKEANDRFGIEGALAFDQPVRAAQAQLMNRWKREELKRQNILGRAAPGVLPGAARLGVGFLVQAMDPLNVASAFIPVVGEARFAYLTGKAGVTGARLTRGAIEGAVGAAVVEPLVYLQAQSEQADYDAYDSLLNVAFGTALGGGLHAGFGKLSDWIRGQPIELRDTALRGAVAAVVEDRPVAVAGVLSAEPRVPIMEVDSADIGGSITRFAAEAIANTKQRLLRIGAVSKAVSDRLAALGVEVSGYSHVLQTDEVRHALQRHGVDAKLKIGELPITEADIARVPEIIETADDIRIERTRQGRQAAIFTKRDDATTVLVEEVRDKKGRLAFKSMRKFQRGSEPPPSGEVEGGPGTTDALEEPQSLRPDREPGAADSIIDAQRATYQPTPDEAAQARSTATLAEGWDQPITPEQGAEEAAELIEATDEMVAAAKRSGDLTDRDLEAIKGDPEAEKLTKGRAAAYEAAAACLSRFA